MESVESSGTRRIVLLIGTVTLVFFAIVAAVWIAFDTTETSLRNGTDEYVEYEEKTKDEVLLDIQQRDAVQLNAEEVEEKQAILESIRRE